MNNHISLYVIAASERRTFSADNVIGVEMATSTQIKIWYRGGTAVTLGVPVMSGNSAATYIANMLYLAANLNPGILEVPDPLGAEVIPSSSSLLGEVPARNPSLTAVNVADITDAAGNTVQISDATIA